MILALNATVDGQTTAHYITDLLHDANVKVTRLAHGVPVGGELDYLDEGTLSAAIRQRTRFDACSRLRASDKYKVRARRPTGKQNPSPRNRPFLHLHLQRLEMPAPAATPASAKAGTAASAQSAKNHGQPVASAI